MVMTGADVIGAYDGFLVGRQDGILVGKGDGVTEGVVVGNFVGL